MFFFGFGREKKYVEDVQAESRQSRSPFFFFLLLFFSLKVPRTFYGPDTLFEAMALQGLPPSTSSDRVDLNTPRKTLTSCFLKGMELENPTVGPKVMALGS